MPRPVNRDEVQRLRHQEAQVVEVLGRTEYEGAHLPGAVNIPLRELDRESAMSLLRRDRPVVVYCFDYQ